MAQGTRPRLSERLDRPVRRVGTQDPDPGPGRRRAIGSGRRLYLGGNEFVPRGRGMAPPRRHHVHRHRRLQRPGPSRRSGWASPPRAPRPAPPSHLREVPRPGAHTKRALRQTRRNSHPEASLCGFERRLSPGIPGRYLRGRGFARPARDRTAAIRAITLVASRWRTRNDSDAVFLARLYMTLDGSRAPAGRGCLSFSGR